MFKAPIFYVKPHERFRSIVEKKSLEHTSVHKISCYSPSNQLDANPYGMYLPRCCGTGPSLPARPPPPCH